MSVRWGDKVIVNSNRRKFLGKLGLRLEDCVFMSLNHGTDIGEVGIKDEGQTFGCDAMVTRDKGVVLFMLTADCFPVVVYDIKKVALVHLGYKNAGVGLIQKVLKMFDKDISVFVGPGIRRESYIFEDVVQKDDPQWQPFLEKTSDGKWMVDLAGFIRKQTGEMGVTNIEDCGIDTAKDLNYFSHYRAVRSREPEGRFATVVMMK